MKVKLIILWMLLFCITSQIYCWVWVNGYYRTDGTYVRPHYRSYPDGIPYNNWSFPGNINLYTGEIATGNIDTYLSNYYKLPRFNYNYFYSPKLPGCRSYNYFKIK